MRRSDARCAASANPSEVMIALVLAGFGRVYHKGHVAVQHDLTRAVNGLLERVGFA